MPKVSVLMPVYNAGRFMKTAIDSILSQTFDDFEFLIIDDGSTDDSINIIRANSDDRIVLVKNKKNLGVSCTLNIGLGAAKGEYIIRMDADDISRSCRIKRQVEFMDANPTIGISGTWVRLFGDQPFVVTRKPVGPSVVGCFLVFYNPLAHPSVILRSKALVENSLKYDPAYSRTEDYDLWSRSNGFFPIDNIPQPLVLMRHHPDSITNQANVRMTEQTEKILGRQLLKLGIKPTRNQLLFHHVVGRGYRLKRWDELERAHAWLTYLSDVNDQKGVFSRAVFSTAVGMVWFQLCTNSTPFGFRIWNYYMKSSIRYGYHPPFQDVVRMLLSILWHQLPQKKHRSRTIQ